MADTGTRVQSIDRVFDIIETLSTATRGMALSGIAAEVGLHVSTTHRLLNSLVSRGYVQKDSGSGKYILTAKLFEVGSRAIGTMDLLSTSRPYLEHLASLSNETIHLVARYGDEVVYLYKEEGGTSTIRMASLVGLRNPMYCTAVGKSILANLSEQEVREIWSRTAVTSLTPNTIIHLDHLLEELELVRTRGYALDREENEAGVLCIGAPLLDFCNRPIGALSISAPATRVDDEKLNYLAAEIVAHANAITRLLGGNPPTQSSPDATSF